MPSLQHAQYLLRFDDLCPTMNWAVWSEIEAALVARNIKPILAVVPDNQDPALKVGPAVANFWERVRRWQSWGWTIGLHGYQHHYVGRHRGLVTPRKNTEFAGLPAAVQEEKLKRGVARFAEEGVRARIWIAPSNSFDRTTVSLLPQVDIHLISDGNFLVPFTDEWQIRWVPQQIFQFRPAPPGVWTVCYHHNQWTESMRREFPLDLDQYRDAIVSLDDVLNQWSRYQPGWIERLYDCPRLSHFLVRCHLKLWALLVADPPRSTQTVPGRTWCPTAPLPSPRITADMSRR